jgi:hypothetical protein
MNTNGSVYPRWEREGRVSRFFVGPSLSVYQVEEIELTGDQCSPHLRRAERI